jgi:hypothetical protein
MNIHLMVFFGLLVFWIFLFRDIRHSIKSYSKTKKYLIITLPPLLMSSQLSYFLSEILYIENFSWWFLLFRTIVFAVMFVLHLVILKKFVS